jgi:transcriptional regulator with XRE-family HTH domain
VRGMNADEPPTPAQQFLALVRPAAQRAGYLDYGGQARLSAETGITDSTLSRMLKGVAIPSVTSFQALAEALNLPVLDLLVAARIISGSSLSESHPPKVRSVPTTPEEAAAALGIKSTTGVALFRGMVETLRNEEPAGADHDEDQGGTAAGQQ